MRKFAFAVLSLCWLSSALAAEFTDTDGLVVEYDFRHESPTQADATPLVRVFGNGRLEVAIPWYRKAAGYYVGQLTQPELNQLLGEISQSGVTKFTGSMLAAEKREAKSKATRLIYASERERSSFSFALKDARTVTQLTWLNLRLDADLYGAKSGKFETLWQIDRRLHGLSAHPSLRKVAEMQPPRRLAR
ncbi:MAG: hypothetical protein AAGA23_20475 [Pseudomonadota bacterium]